MRELNKRPLMTGELLCRYFKIVSCDATHFCSRPNVWLNWTCGVMCLLLMWLDHREGGKDARPSSNVRGKPQVLMFNNWLGWRSGLAVMTGTGWDWDIRWARVKTQASTVCRSALLNDARKGWTVRADCEWVMWGMVYLVKGPPWCQHRETGTWCPP